MRSATHGREEGENYRPALLSTTDISTITAPSTSAPPLHSPSPFIGWTVDDCYQFFLLNISATGNEVSGPWTAHTFVVLDAQTAEDGRTCHLCSDVPDYLERHRTVLKSVRSTFKPVLVEGMCYETFVRRPSESGGGALGAGEVMTGNENFLGLSFMPPLAFMEPEERRANLSYGLTNDSIKPGRRFWDRYVEENERNDSEKDQNDKI